MEITYSIQVSKHLRAVLLFIVLILLSGVSIAHTVIKDKPVPDSSIEQYPAIINKQN